MSPSDRVDEILRLIDETLAEAGTPADGERVAAVTEDPMPLRLRPSSAA